MLRTLILIALPSLLAATRVLCIGEALFDGLPGGIYLGGAPVNAAVHLAEAGCKPSFVSAVGRDRLGREVLRRLGSRGVDISLVATIDDAETGFVEVDIDAKGDASYTFATPAAWDLVPSAGIASAASAADAVVFGSLGSRDATSRAAVLAAAEASTFSVCDVNLRPPFVDDDVVAEAVSGVDLLKLNDEELVPLAATLSKVAADDTAATAAAKASEAAQSAAAAFASRAPEETLRNLIGEAARAIGEAAGARTVVVTRGAEGAVMCRGGTGEAWAHPGFVPPVVVDSVGAGDAFLAAFLACMLNEGGAPDAALEAGCRCGAFVASRAGATPAHEADAMDALQPRGGGGGAVKLTLS